MHIFELDFTDCIHQIGRIRLVNNVKRLFQEGNEFLSIHNLVIILLELINNDVQRVENLSKRKCKVSAWFNCTPAKFTLTCLTYVENVAKSLGDNSPRAIRRAINEAPTK